jgi:hypothetical protein
MIEPNITQYITKSDILYNKKKRLISSNQGRLSLQLYYEINKKISFELRFEKRVITLVISGRSRSGII